MLCTMGQRTYITNTKILNQIFLHHSGFQSWVKLWNVASVTGFIPMSRSQLHLYNTDSCVLARALRNFCPYFIQLGRHLTKTERCSAPWFCQGFRCRLKICIKVIIPYSFSKTIYYMTFIKFDPYVSNRGWHKYENNIRFAFSTTLSIVDQKGSDLSKKKQQQFWDALTYPPNFHSTLQIKAKLALA